MICRKCKNEFKESELDESHDIPCYLFPGNRKAQKNQADNLGRHLLCKKHHKEYDEAMQLFLMDSALKFKNKYFKEEDDTNTT